MCVSEVQANEKDYEVTNEMISVVKKQIVFQNYSIFCIQAVASGDSLVLLLHQRQVRAQTRLDWRI